MRLHRDHQRIRFADAVRDLRHVVIVCINDWHKSHAHVRPNDFEGVFLAVNLQDDIAAKMKFWLVLQKRGRDDHRVIVVRLRAICLRRWSGETIRLSGWTVGANM